jgi:F-type H+-transporting ATPase subunit b
VKRSLLLLAGVAVLAVCGWAQHEPLKGSGPVNEGETAGKHEVSIGWKWANFAILMVVLGYMGGKTLPPFFRSRTAEIQKGIAEAAALKADAERRAAAIEQRMASLHTEIEQIRMEARAEMAKEGERIRLEADQHLARMQAHSEQEIAAMTKRATQELKAYSAELAIQLAAQRIRARMSEDVQGALLRQFVQQLDDRRPREASI